MSKARHPFPSEGKTSTLHREGGIYVPLMVVRISQHGDAPATIYGWEFPDPTREAGATVRFVACDWDQEAGMLRDAVLVPPT